MSVEEPQGTFACPICGKDSPHQHSSEEVARQRASEKTRNRHHWHLVNKSHPTAKGWDYYPAIVTGEAKEIGYAGGDHAIAIIEEHNRVVDAFLAKKESHTTYDPSLMIWQPIRTAPKNELIDIWVSGPGARRVTDCRWGVPHLQGPSGFGYTIGGVNTEQWVTMGGFGLDPRNGAPTHWMRSAAGPGQKVQDPVTGLPIASISERTRTAWNDALKEAIAACKSVEQECIDAGQIGRSRVAATCWGSIEEFLDEKTFDEILSEIRRKGEAK